MAKGVQLTVHQGADGQFSRFVLDWEPKGFTADGPAAVTSWMQAYAAGQHLPFELPAPSMSPFQVKVLKYLSRIPFGETRSYGEIATDIGHPGAARAVGTACAGNPFPLIIPCHRVLAAGSKIGGYAYGPEMKRLLLEHERSFGIASA